MNQPSNSNTMNQTMQLLEELTSEAVPRVFQDLLSIELHPDATPRVMDDPAAQIIGSVGFIGDTTGIIYLYASMEFARQITGTMLGISEAEVEGEEMVADAIGELSNIVVGSVKSRLCDSGKHCTLTIPSVVCGRHLTVEAASNIHQKILGFHNSHHYLRAELLLKV